MNSIPKIKVEELIYQNIDSMISVQSKPFLKKVNKVLENISFIEDYQLDLLLNYIDNELLLLPF